MISGGSVSFDLMFWSSLARSSDSVLIYITYQQLDVVVNCKLAKKLVQVCFTKNSHSNSFSSKGIQDLPIFSGTEYVGRFQ